MESDYQRLLSQVETLADLPPNHASEVLSLKTRRELRKKLRKLIIALDDPGDIVDKVIYAPADVVVIRIAINIGLFKILDESDTPKTAQDLAKELQIDEVLLGRILRSLAGIDAVADAGTNGYVATKVSRAFLTKKGKSGTGTFINSLIPAWFKLPENLAQNGYQNPSDPFHCAFNASFNTTDNIFEWYPKHPDVLDEFNEFMSSQREGHAYWLDFFPFDQQVGNPRANDTSDVLFVDVGGAVGNEVREIRKRYPTLPGRMILQDLPQTIAQAKGMGDFEVMVHDFFTPQPVKGAGAYYFRNVFHDWPDKQCRLILQHTCTAMTRGYSKVLINEMVVPLQGGDLFAVQSDINMMSTTTGMERTKDQWHDLLGSVGLKIVKIWTEDPDSESIIEAMLA